MKFSLFFAAAAASMALAGPVLAQEAAPVNAERLRLAHELVQVMGGQAQIAAFMRHSLSAVPADQEKSAGDDAIEVDDRLRKILAMVPAASEVSATVLADTLSEKELGDLIAYYRAPAHQAEAAKLGVLSERAGISLIVVMNTLRVEMLENACDHIACSADHQGEVDTIRPPAPMKAKPDPLKDGYDQ